MKGLLIQAARRFGLYFLARRAKMFLLQALPRTLRRDDSLTFYSQLIRPGDLVFDVGANVGIKTKTFLALGAQVICVEPNEDVLRELRAVFGRNPRVRIVEAALGAAPGRGELFIDRQHSGLSTMSSRWMREGRYADVETWERGHAVTITTLDNLISRFGVPAFCKIDVEGYEVEVLRGLGYPIPLVSFEFHSELRDELIECAKLLEAIAPYTFNLVLEGGNRFHFPNWVSGPEMRSWSDLDEALSLEGEIYARLQVQEMPYKGAF